MQLLLVHYSDPHIGSTLTGGGLIWKATGHDQEALEAFFSALGRIRRMPVDLRVLVHSGDASGRGADAQLDLYFTLRNNGTTFHANGNLSFPGFRRRFERVLDIPGNHDYWAGVPVNPILNVNVRRRWAQDRWTTTIPLATHELVLHGVCSTSGASARQQLFAVGEFHASDLNDLEDRIVASTRTSRRATQVHVIVTHHSPSAGSGRVHGLADASAEALRQVCRRHHIAAVLTGHAHNHAIVHSENLPVEVRCATTLQYNKWPQKQVRQFWLHRIEERNAGLQWTATAWLYENRRFVEVRPERAVFVA